MKSIVVVYEDTMYPSVVVTLLKLLAEDVILAKPVAPGTSPHNPKSVYIWAIDEGIDVETMKIVYLYIEDNRLSGEYVMTLSAEELLTITPTEDCTKYGSPLRDTTRIHEIFSLVKLGRNVVQPLNPVAGRLSYISGKFCSHLLQNSSEPEGLSRELSNLMAMSTEDWEKFKGSLAPNKVK